MTDLTDAARAAVGAARASVTAAHDQLIAARNALGLAGLHDAASDIDQLARMTAPAMAAMRLRSADAALAPAAEGGPDPEPDLAE